MLSESLRSRQLVLPLLFFLSGGIGVHGGATIVSPIQKWSSPTAAADCAASVERFSGIRENASARSRRCSADRCRRRWATGDHRPISLFPSILSSIVDVIILFFMFTVRVFTSRSLIITAHAHDITQPRLDNSPSGPSSMHKRLNSVPNYKWWCSQFFNMMNHIHLPSG